MGGNKKQYDPRAWGKDAEAGMAVLTLIENLEELDDTNKVYHNLELTDELMSQMA